MLTKIKVVVSFAVALSLVFSQSVVAQEREPQKKVRNPAREYGKFLHKTNSFMVQVKAVCKTEECTSLSNQGSKLIADAMDKRHNHLLIEEEKNKFHAALKTHLFKIVTALQGQEAQRQVAAKQQGQAAAARMLNQKLLASRPCPTIKKIQSGIDTSQECELCSQVYEQAAGICSLYSGWSNGAALICLGVATIAWLNCKDRWCGGYIPQDGFDFYNTDNYDNVGSGGSQGGGVDNRDEIMIMEED